MLTCMQEVPVLPVLAKADSMTGPELERFRQHVRNEMYRVRENKYNLFLFSQNKSPAASFQSLLLNGVPGVSSREAGSSQIAILSVQHWTLKLSDASKPDWCVTAALAGLQLLLCPLRSLTA